MYVWYGMVWYGIGIGLYWYVLVCIGVYWYVLVCIGMYWYALVCIGMYWYVLVCIAMHWYVLVCIGISKHETNTGFKQGYQLIQKKIGLVFERYP